MRKPGAAVLGAFVLGASLAAAPASRAQAPSPAPAATPPPGARVFPAGIEQVTVDVVVLDRQGKVVPGLTRDDFTVLDEGKPQEIQTFEVVRPRGGALPAAPSAAPVRPRVASNAVVPGARGRQFVILFDDLHLTPVHAQAAKASVAAFLEKGTQEGDRVLLAATGGGAWWTTRLEGGRSDLMGVLKGLEGRRLLDNAGDRLTDFEAMRIFVYHDAPVALRVMERLDRYGSTSRQDMQAANREQAQGTDLAGIIDPYIEMRASEAYFKLKSRMDLTLRVLSRALKSLDETKERKAVILVSEGFVNDPSNAGMQQVTEAARRANAAIYFIDARGLQALSLGYSAEFGPALPDQDRMAAIADVSTDAEGAASLATDTGGFSVRNTNDFASGAVRVGRESSSYYLLGYNPGPIVRDGKFRKLQVKVRGRGYSVRARRGYYAMPEGESASASAAVPSPKGTDAVLQRALDAPGLADGVPLNLAAYVQQASDGRHARVTIAAEADVSAVGSREVDGKPIATLETLLVVQHRDSGEMQRRDQTVELELRPAPPGQAVWYSFTREVELPAGVQQARLIVRDAVKKKVGSVVLDFEVPPLDGLRVSTPVVTDRLQRALDGTLSPALTVRHTFAKGGQLFCSYDVFAAARGPDGRPQVKAGHALRRRDGTLLGESAPNAIQPTSIGALTRLIQIPLGGTPPGDYELVLTVEDTVSGQKRELVEPFTITPANAPQPSE